MVTKLCALGGVVACASGALAMPTASTADVTDTLANATEAAGAFMGNDVGAMGTGLTNLNDLDVFTEDTWQYVGQSDEPNTPYTNNPDGETDETLFFIEPQDGPFVISLKAGDFYSLYYFDATFQGVTQIDFVTGGVALNPSGQPLGFSHSTLYRATVIPAPGALALAGIGGIVGVRRRRA